MQFLRMAAGLSAGVFGILLYTAAFAWLNDCLVSNPAHALLSSCMDRAVLWAVPAAIIWTILGFSLARKVNDEWTEPVATAAVLPWLALVPFGYEWVKLWGPKILAIGVLIVLASVALFTKTGRFLVIVALLVWIGSRLGS